MKISLESSHDPPNEKNRLNINLNIQHNTFRFMNNVQGVCVLQKQALTCLAAISFPSGIGAPFSVAMRFKVARAFSWFPVSTSYRALSGSHCRKKRKNKTCQLIKPSFVMFKYCFNTILTKHRKAKMKRGMVERPSSHRQPKVGITKIAKRTSNTVPSAQNICKVIIYIKSC